MKSDVAPWTLVCTSEQAREGCVAIANHVILLCNSSEAVRVRSLRLEKPALLRYSYILTLVALEEAGKLFELWQAASESEQSENDKVAVDSWKDHKRKGGKAGDLCCQMLDFVSNLGDLPGADGASNETWNELQNEMTESRRHLSDVYPRFREERLRVLYVDFIDSKWTDGNSPSMRVIEAENFLLSIVARTARAYLDRTDSSFTASVRMLSRMKDRERIDAGSHEFLQLIFQQVGQFGLEGFGELKEETRSILKDMLEE